LMLRHTHPFVHATSMAAVRHATVVAHSTRSARAARAAYAAHAAHAVLPNVAVQVTIAHAQATLDCHRTLDCHYTCEPKRMIERSRFMRTTNTTNAGQRIELLHGSRRACQSRDVGLLGLKLTAGVACSVGVNRAPRRRADPSVRPSMHAYTAHITISGIVMNAECVPH
jgi:hypothetical protein